MPEIYNARLYCSKCKEVTEHVKLQDSQGMGEATEKYSFGIPVIKDAARIYGNIIGGFALPIVNGVSQWFLGKNIAKYWKCESCGDVHERNLES